MNPAEVINALNDITEHSKRVWLAEGTRGRIKAAPFSILGKEVIKKLLRVGLKLGLVPSVIRAKTFYGAEVRAPLWSALPLKAKGFHSGEDLKLTKFISDTLKPGDVFIDGGANYGWYSLLASALGAKVYAVEPTPKVFDILVKNAEGKNITAYPVALWSSAGEMTFNDLGKGNDVINTLLDPSRFGWKGRVTTYTVKTIILDDLPRADFIKLDCEGAEYEILKGTKKALDNRPILVVELAASARESGVWGKIVDMLAEKGYKSYYIGDDYKLAPLAEEGGKAAVVNAVFC